MLLLLDFLRIAYAWNIQGRLMKNITVLSWPRRFNQRIHGTGKNAKPTSIYKT